jgi:hypothetical protein
MQPGETICMWPVRAAGASLGRGRPDKKPVARQHDPSQMCHSVISRSLWGSTRPCAHAGCRGSRGVVGAPLLRWTPAVLAATLMVHSRSGPRRPLRRNPGTGWVVHVAGIRGFPAPTSGNWDRQLYSACRHVDSGVVVHPARTGSGPSPMACWAGSRRPSATTSAASALHPGSGTVGLAPSSSGADAAYTRRPWVRPPTQATPRPVLRDRERGSRRVGRETSSCLPRPTGARTVAPSAVASDHEGR